MDDVTVAVLQELKDEMRRLREEVVRLRGDVALLKLGDPPRGVTVRRCGHRPQPPYGVPTPLPCDLPLGHAGYHHCEPKYKQRSPRMLG